MCVCVDVCVCGGSEDLEGGLTQNKGESEIQFGLRADLVCQVIKNLVCQVIKKDATMYLHPLVPALGPAGLRGYVTLWNPSPEILVDVVYGVNRLALII